VDVDGFAFPSELLDKSNGLIELIDIWGSVVDHGEVELEGEEGGEGECD